MTTTLGRLLTDAAEYTHRVKAIQLKDTITFDVNNVTYIGQPGDYLVNTGCCITVYSAEEFESKFKPTKRPRKPQYKIKSKEEVQSQWDEIKSTLTEHERVRANQTIDAMDKCVSMKIDTQSLKTLLLVARWVKTYKMLDLAREIHKAENWLISQGRKSPKGLMFITNWLNRKPV